MSQAGSCYISLLTRSDQNNLEVRFYFDIMHRTKVFCQLLSVTYFIKGNFLGSPTMVDSSHL